MTDVTIRVSTEKLLSTSVEVEGKIRQLEKALNDAQRIVEACKSYWDGEGPTAYITAYREKTEVIEKAFLRFRENVTDLQTIAGVYTQAEKSAVEINQELQVDLIV